MIVMPRMSRPRVILLGLLVVSVLALYFTKINFINISNFGQITDKLFPLRDGDRCFDLRSSEDLVKFGLVLEEADSGGGGEVLEEADSGRGWENMSVGCGRLVQAVRRVYEVQVAAGKVIMDKQMRNKMEEWLGGDEELVKQAEHQSVLHIHNLWSLESTMINPLRAKRPGQINLNNHTAVLDMISSARSSCDFCSYKTQTASDIFGRVTGNYSATAANLFKIQGPHNGMVIMLEHSFLDLTGPMFGDMFAVARTWFYKANKEDGRAKYPSIAWDLLIHAGASQIHPHFHLYLDRRRHQGHFGQLEAAEEAYKKATGGDYWQDVVDIHMALGLAVKLGNASILVPLTSHKDHEFLVVYAGSELDELGSVLGTITATYTSRLSVLCWNMGVAWPALPALPGPDHPTILRIGSRGDCTRVRSDVSSLELYTFYSLNVDPYKTIQNIKLQIGSSNSTSF